MNLLKKIFGGEDKKSKSTAKERLSIVLAHERTVNIEFIDDLKADIMEVVKKYIKEPSDISFRTSENRDISALEVEIKM